eukprot:6022933-Ditylum_brightwellii.AAC.1
MTAMKMRHCQEHHTTQTKNMSNQSHLTYRMKQPNLQHHNLSLTLFQYNQRRTSIEVIPPDKRIRNDGEPLSHTTTDKEEEHDKSEKSTAVIQPDERIRNKGEPLSNTTEEEEHDKSEARQRIEQIEMKDEAVVDTVSKIQMASKQRAQQDEVKKEKEGEPLSNTTEEEEYNIIDNKQ